MIIEDKTTAVTCSGTVVVSSNSGHKFRRGDISLQAEGADSKMSSFAPLSDNSIALLCLSNFLHFFIVLLAWTNSFLSSFVPESFRVKNLETKHFKTPKSAAASKNLVFA